MFNGKTHYKWPFSIAMLNYQRVCSTTCWSSLVIKWELNKIGVDNPKGRPCGLGSHIDLQMWSCFMRNMFEQKHTKTMCFFHDFELLQTSKVPFSRWCTAPFFSLNWKLLQKVPILGWFHLVPPWSMNLDEIMTSRRDVTGMMVARGIIAGRKFQLSSGQ